MILISLVIALAAEFHFKIGSEFRQFIWFKKMIDFFNQQFASRSFFEGWIGVAIIILSPIAVLAGFISLFSGPLHWLVLFVVSIVLLFLSLGPKPLEKSFSEYFASMEREDFEAAFLHLSVRQEASDSLSGIDDEEENNIESNSEQSLSPEKDELVRSATRKMLIESQKRYFGVIAWFILLGPLAALFYRLAFLYRDHCADEEFDEHLPIMETVIHWIDWIPSRITSMMFLLTGDFANGFYRIKDYLTDAAADNQQLISETGIAALGLDMGISDGDVDENYKTMDMIERTAIFYLVLGAVAALIV